MKFQLPQYKKFRKDFIAIAKRFSLSPQHLTVEFYTPDRQVILTERVEDHDIKIHIDLEQGRIISVQSVSPGLNGNFEGLTRKYREFMR